MRFGSTFISFSCSFAKWIRAYWHIGILLYTAQSINILYCFKPKKSILPAASPLPASEYHAVAYTLNCLGLALFCTFIHLPNPFSLVSLSILLAMKRNFMWFFFCLPPAKLTNCKLINWFAVEFVLRPVPHVCLPHCRTATLPRSMLCALLATQIQFVGNTQCLPRFGNLLRHEMPRGRAMDLCVAGSMDVRVEAKDGCWVLNTL